jgi:hypothetical protein
MAAWRSALQVNGSTIRLLVTSSAGDDLLKAQLPARAKHPRSLLTVLEGMSLWSGHPMHAAISVVGAVDPGLELGALESLWPTESALVRLDFVEPHRRRRIAGLGDFRQLRLLAHEEE